MTDRLTFTQETQNPSNELGVLFEDTNQQTDFSEKTSLPEQSNEDNQEFERLFSKKTEGLNTDEKKLFRQNLLDCALVFRKDKNTILEEASPQFINDAATILFRDSLSKIYNRVFLNAKLLEKTQTIFESCGISEDAQKNAKPEEILNLMEGVSHEQLEQNEFQFLFIDLSYLTTANKRDYAIGDSLIEVTGKVILQMAEKYPDIVEIPARQGGDEFIIILHGSKEDATMISEELRKEIDAAGKIAIMSIKEKNEEGAESVVEIIENMHMDIGSMSFVDAFNIQKDILKKIIDQNEDSEIKEVRYNLPNKIISFMSKVADKESNANKADDRIALLYPYAKFLRKFFHSLSGLFKGALNASVDEILELDSPKKIRDYVKKKIGSEKGHHDRAEDTLYEGLVNDAVIDYVLEKLESKPINEELHETELQKRREKIIELIKKHATNLGNKGFIGIAKNFMDRKKSNDKNNDPRLSEEWKQIDQRKQDLDARENALNEREKQINKREQKLAEREQLLLQTVQNKIRQIKSLFNTANQLTNEPDKIKMTDALKEILHQSEAIEDNSFAI